MSVDLGDPGLKVIGIVVVAAHGLAKPDDSSLPDPFAVILVDSKRAHTTSVIKQTLQPYWNEHFDVMVKRSSVVKVQVFDQRKFEPRDIGFVEIRVTDYLDLELGGQELVLLDLKGADDNPAVQGKLISRLSANVTTSATGSYPTDSSLALTSLPSNDYRHSVNNESICNESVYHASVNSESIYNESVYHASVNSESIYNESAYHASFDNASVTNASMDLYGLSINTQNSHTPSSEVPPIIALPTTLIPGAHVEQQQSLPNIPTRPVTPGGTSTDAHPQNPQRSAAPGKPITNAQHNLDANEAQYGPLPEGWESGIDVFGLTYYANRHTRSITRNRPSLNQAVDHQAQEGETTIRYPNRRQGSLQPQAISQLGPLPSVWEMQLMPTKRQPSLKPRESTASMGSTGSSNGDSTNSDARAASDADIIETVRVPHVHTDKNEKHHKNNKKLKRGAGKMLALFGSPR